MTVSGPVPVLPLPWTWRERLKMDVPLPLAVELANWTVAPDRILLAPKNALKLKFKVVNEAVSLLMVIATLVRLTALLNVYVPAPPEPAVIVVPAGMPLPLTTLPVNVVPVTADRTTVVELPVVLPVAVTPALVT